MCVSDCVCVSVCVSVCVLQLLTYCSVDDDLMAAIQAGHTL